MHICSRAVGLRSQPGTIGIIAETHDRRIGVNHLVGRLNAIEREIDSGIEISCALDGTGTLLLHLHSMSQQTSTYTQHPENHSDAANRHQRLLS